jgi:hypothetical protein
VVLLDVKGGRSCNKNLQSRTNHLHTPRVRDASPLYFALPSRRLLLDAANALDALTGTAMAVKRKTDSSAATVAQKKSRTRTNASFPTYMTSLPANSPQSLPRLPQTWIGLQTIRLI